MSRRHLSLVPLHAPSTDTAADPTLIGCICGGYLQRVPAPEDRPDAWKGHALSQGMSVRQIGQALSVSDMIRETFAVTPAPASTSWRLEPCEVDR